jgi:hypothetical protein
LAFQNETISRRKREKVICRANRRYRQFGLGGLCLPGHKLAVKSADSFSSFAYLT